MKKKYFYKKCCTACIGLVMFCSMNAQQPTAAGVQDTVQLHNAKPDLMPGRLFSTSKQSNTAAISTVNGETLYRTVTPNITNTLYGRLPGLTVVQNSGEPGNDDASLAIRGIGSYGYSAYGSFKVFVDGFEANQNYFRSLSPSEIESISILKDAAALATFGMRGGNGVLWVTTKRGSIAKPTVQFNARTAVQKPMNLYKPLRSFDYARLYNQAVSNDKGNVWTPYYTDAQLQAYQAGTGVDVDWYDQVLQKTGNYSDADLIFSGGENDIRYSVVMNYATQGGLFNVPNTDTSSNETYKRYNLRANLDFRMFSIFEAKVDVNSRIEQRQMPNYGNPVSAVINRSDNVSTYPIWNQLANYPSNIYPVYDGNSSNWSGSAIYPNNPVATVSDQGWRSFKNRSLQGNFELKERLDGLLLGLYAKQAFSFNSWSVSDYNKTASYSRYLNGVKTTNDQTSPITATNLGARQQEDWKQATATVGYQRNLGTNNLHAAVNYHQSDYRGDGFFATIYRYQNISGRANYSLNNRIVGEFGFSYFGTDAFAEENRWQFYPSVSTAWIVSNEDFLQNNKTFTYVKLRASAGKTGFTDSDEGSLLSGQNGRYLYQQYYSGSTVFYTGDAQANGQTGLNPLYIANPSIRAEESWKYNAGLDIAILEKLDVTIDVYLDKRSGIITRDNTVPASYGNNSISRNIGKVTNRGIEVSAQYTEKVGNFTYAFTGMAYFNKSRIDEMGEVLPINEFTARTGRAIGTPIGLVAEGFYDIVDFNPDGTLKSGLAVPAFGRVQAGDIRYKDIDNNGIVDNDDRTAIGNPELPQLSYSFGTKLGYGGFELSIFLQGRGNTSVNILGAQTQAFLNNGNVFPIAMNAWAYYPTQNIDTRSTATYPRLSTLANDNNYRTSSVWIKNGSYLRIRNIELGYAFAPRFLAKTGLEKARIFIGATNPVTWSQLEKEYGIDPETPFGYPALKSFNAGLSLSF